MDIADSLMEIITENLKILDSANVEYLELSLSSEVAEEFRKKFISEYGDKYQVKLKGILFDKLWDRELRNIKAILLETSGRNNFDEYVVQIRRKS